MRQVFDGPCPPLRNADRTDFRTVSFDPLRHAVLKEVLAKGIVQCVREGFVDSTVPPRQDPHVARFSSGLASLPYGAIEIIVDMLWQRGGDECACLRACQIGIATLATLDPDSDPPLRTARAGDCVQLWVPRRHPRSLLTHPPQFPPVRPQ